MVTVTTPIVIGLTGGIGSGKTTVANMFRQHQVPIIDADKISHQITTPQGIAYHKIIAHFGQAILTQDKTIDRKKLRDIIFENSAEKKWLEDFLHPLIRQKMKEDIKKITAHYCICVIPLLAESTGIDFIDRVLVIDAPLEKQRLRAKTRDKTTDEAIQKIIASQVSQLARLKLANDILINDGDLTQLEEKVAQLHQYYLMLQH